MLITKNNHENSLQTQTVCQMEGPQVVSMLLRCTINGLDSRWLALLISEDDDVFTIVAGLYDCGGRCR